MLSLFVVDTRANPDASFSIGAVFVVTPSSVSAFGTGHRLTNVMSTGDAGCHKAAREVTSHHVKAHHRRHLHRHRHRHSDQ